MHEKVKVKISNNNKKSYDIYIGPSDDGSLSFAAADIVKKFPKSKCFIITDTNVEKLYARNFNNFLKRQGVTSKVFTFQAGEKSKTRKTKEYLENQLIKSGANRNSVIIALGGGVVGDIAGFVAATLFRGVPFIQIPTTLLAQVDSSVGGKVGLNHPLGKNLIGAFYQPDTVYIDVSTLQTISDEEYRNGLAEVVKYGASLDVKLFELLVRNYKKILSRDTKLLKNIIERCCELKAEVVNKDEKEKSYRRILNFGHTIGHALEKLSNYKIPHGAAVSIGMVAEAEMAFRLKILNRKSVVKLKMLLTHFGLPTDLPKNYSVPDYVEATQTDKKAVEDIILYTLIEKIGSGVIDVPLTAEDVEALLIARNYLTKLRL
ncbi:MAG: 3-dehydroquinate synthase [Bacteroidota bacterium]|nr:3-dehydroquinate synthase [Bacteroidota bacterium]